MTISHTPKPVDLSKPVIARRIMLVGDKTIQIGEIFPWEELGIPLRQVNLYVENGMVENASEEAALEYLEGKEERDREAAEQAEKEKAEAEKLAAEEEAKKLADGESTETSEEKTEESPEGEKPQEQTEAPNDAEGDSKENTEDEKSEEGETAKEGDGAEKEEPIFRLEQTDSPAWWNIVDQEGKHQTERAMRKDDAEALLKELLAE